MPRFAISAVALAAALALGGCGGGGSSAITTLPDGNALPCPAQQQGALCVKIFRDGETLQDVIAYLTASGSPLEGKTWRLVASVGGRSYPGPARRGDPPVDPECYPNSKKPDCTITLAEELASRGDFSPLQLPQQVPLNTQICVSEQLRSGSAWHDASQPTKACTTTS